VQQYDFNDLYDGLTSDHGLTGAIEVAEACLKFATSQTRTQYPSFSSSAWPKFATKNNLWDLVPHNLSTGGELEYKKIATAIKGIDDADKPLAAWVIAQLIATAIEGKFATFTTRRTKHTLENLQGFILPVESANTLHGGHRGLSAEPGPNLNHYDPSAVDGLKLWLDEPLLHGQFKVTIDKAGGAQFDAALGAGKKLKIALIQPNKNLMELSVDRVSPESEAHRDPRFFGVGPRCAKTQTKKVIKGLKLAAAAGAGVVLLPELVMTEAIAGKIATELGTPGKIIPHGTPEHALKVVVSGSYHHVETDDCGRKFRRNSTQVLFPRTPGPMLQRQHSKSGKFVYPATQAVMEAWKRSPWLFHWPAVFTLFKQMLTTRAKQNLRSVPEFREDVKPATQIRLFAGPRFSVVVVICADLLDKTFRRVLETLQPSLVLVCNMTPKQGDFASAAHALILAGQSTLVSVNNPATWSKSGGIFGSAVPGGLVGLPVRDGNKRVIEAAVASKKILIFDFESRQLQAYPR